MKPDFGALYPLYGARPPKALREIDTSRGQDIRVTYIVRYPGEEKIVIKAARNAFTTPERVHGWAQLCAHYNGLGVYCPNILQNVYGEVWAQIDGYTVYAEEFAQYKPAEKAVPGRPCAQKYWRRMLESVGMIAAHPAPLVSWPTAFCLYDKFADDDPSDENMECATAFVDRISQNAPDRLPRAQALFGQYLSRRAAFEREYRSLPRAVFQGDLNDSNILLTKGGNFKGLFDFNLSGTETILNYAFSECFEYFDDEGEIGRLTDRDALKARDEATARNLSYVGGRYAFTAAERAAFNEYYNIFTPYRWRNYCYLNHFLQKDGEKYAGDILDWVEYQMTRTDARDLLPR